jgi:hypothetical protein
MPGPVELLTASQAATVVRVVVRRIARGRDIETWDLELMGLARSEPVASDAFRVERPAGSGSPHALVDQYVDHALGRVDLERLESWRVIDAGTMIAAVGRRPLDPAAG